MKTLTFTEKDIHKGPLMLVNRQHAIREAFERELNIQPAAPDNKISLAPLAGTMLKRLLKSCNGEDEIVPVSGYRSYREQRDIYTDSMMENGEEFTLKYVAYPGCSEHQTGLAVDVAKQSNQIDFICPEFPYTGICQKFRDRAADFGFIERYQKGKEQITGISQEPWHFRYVGYPHSKIMEENDLSLEEYIYLLRYHRHEKNPLQIQEKSRLIEVSFLEMTENKGCSIDIQDELCQVSGNNVDGIIITVWRRQM